MEIVNPDINAYAEKHSDPEPDTLAKLNRETHANVLMPRMLSGHLQGRILSMISKLTGPRFILEIGTYTGYSAICLAEGLTPGGKLHTIDINDEREGLIKKYIRMAGMENRIECHTGNAMDIIPHLPSDFDLVFIDADKSNYSNYYKLVFNKVRPGGIILADNVLWSGKILDDKKSMDKDTLALDEFNRMVSSDNRVEKLILPVRDGIFIIRKKNESIA